MSYIGYLNCIETSFINKSLQFYQWGLMALRHPPLGWVNSKDRPTRSHCAFVLCNIFPRMALSCNFFDDSWRNATDSESKIFFSQLDCSQTPPQQLHRETAHQRTVRATENRVGPYFSVCCSFLMWLRVFWVGGWVGWWSACLWVAWCLCN